MTNKPTHPVLSQRRRTICRRHRRLIEAIRLRTTLKKRNGCTRPISYWYRGKADSKAKIATTNKNCFAVVWAIILLLQYLKGSRFSIRSYHKALKWLLDETKGADELARSRLRLLKFVFVVLRRVGQKHNAPNAHRANKRWTQQNKRR